MPIMNEYLDDNEYTSDPIKVHINEYYYRFNKLGANFQVLKASMNYAILEDSWWLNFFGGKNESFIQTKEFYNFNTNPNLINGYMNTLIILDEMVTTITRTNLSVWDALSKTGGIISVIMIGLGMLISNYKKLSFYAALLS